MKFKIPSLHLNPPNNPIRNIYDDEKVCERRMELYKILRSQEYEPDLLKWLLSLHEEIAKKELYDFFLLLDENKEFLCDNDDVLKIFKSHPLKKYYEDDETGHFMLGLVCSTSEELKALFLDLEVQWFKLRFYSNVSKRKITEFLKCHNITIPEAPLEDRLDLEYKIMLFFDIFDDQIFYKVRFTEVPDLIKNREVLVKNGFLYFPQQLKYIGSYLEHFLRSRWKEKLNKISEYFKLFERDERLRDMMNRLLAPLKQILYYSGEYETGELTLETVYRHSAKFFPLCMSQLQQFLEEKSHLKHFARRQYCVFLKNAGMPFEDAIQLLENEMTKKMSEEEFKKRYFYYFSHCYGRVGSRINYFPESCKDIITNIPDGPQQEHGCPYAHSSEAALREILIKNGVENVVINEILEKTRQKKYEKACCLYFRTKVGQNLEQVVSPNSYYKCAFNKHQNDIVDIEDIFADADD